MIAFKCRHCGKTMEVATASAGKGEKCPACGKETIVPVPAAGSSRLSLGDILLYVGLALILVACVCWAPFLAGEYDNSSQQVLARIDEAIRCLRAIFLLLMGGGCLVVADRLRRKKK